MNEGGGGEQVAKHEVSNDDDQYNEDHMGV